MIMLKRLVRKQKRDNSTSSGNDEHIPTAQPQEVSGHGLLQRRLAPFTAKSKKDSSPCQFSTMFEGFIPQNNPVSQSEEPRKCLGLPADGALTASLVEMGYETSQICFIGFSSNGKHLICVEYKLPQNSSDSCAWNKYLPVSQILVFECYMHNSVIQKTSAYPFVFSGGTEIQDQNLALALAASHNLQFIAIHCVSLSRTSNLLAICGFNSMDKPRKPTVQVYEMKDNAISNNNYNEIFITKISKFSFTKSGILTAKITSCSFSPSSDLILVTALCDDFSTFARTNYIDFWNSKLGVHMGRIDLRNEAKDFRGYVTLLSFSCNGSILTIFSSAVECQILLYSVEKLKLGKLSSICPVNYHLLDKHCLVYSQFTPLIDENCFVLCTSKGLLARLTVNEDNLTVTVDSIIQLSYTLFQSVPDISEDHLSSVVGFVFCPATSRYFIRTNMILMVMDSSAYTVEKVIRVDYTLLDNPSANFTMNTENLSQSMSLSKTGCELAIFSKGTEIYVFLNQNNDISLLNLCRQKIIRHIAEERIHTLPLPNSLKKYLLFGKC